MFSDCDETDSYCLSADNTDMDMADVEIGAGCSQEAEKGGACREDELCCTVCSTPGSIIN